MSDQPIRVNKIWSCKIGEHSPTRVGADGPMRNAVANAYEAMTGHRPAFIFSGWGGTLDEGERAFVENRMPVYPEDAAQPPCGADGAVRDVAALASAVRDIPSRIESLGGQRFAYVKLSEVIDTIYAHASQPAAPVSPATVVPEADPFGVDADLCGELHELDTDIGYRAASRIGQLAMLAAAKKKEGE